MYKNIGYKNTTVEYTVTMLIVYVKILVMAVTVTKNVVVNR